MGGLSIRNINSNGIIIEFKEVTKRYKDVVALNNVTFTLKKGIIGLVGPNGAGKSTSIKLIFNLIYPTTGEIFVLGKHSIKDSLSIRRLLGFAHTSQSFPPGYTADTYLDLVSFFYKLNPDKATNRKKNLLKYFGLDGAAQRPISTYSSGMKQKLALVQAFMNESAKIIILDEPTANLDSLARIKLAKLIRQVYTKNDVSVIISSHSLLELEEICTDYLLLYKGTVLWQGNAEEITATNLSEFYLTQLKRIGDVKDMELEL